MQVTVAPVQRFKILYSGLAMECASRIMAFDAICPTSPRYSIWTRSTLHCGSAFFIFSIPASVIFVP